MKLHRKVLEWEWYDDLNVFRLFMHLILTANHKDKKYKGVMIKKGSVMTGYHKLSHDTGLSVQQTRTALSKLKSTNEITIKTSPKGTIIQVVAYEDYQEQQTEQQVKQQTINKQVTTNKNVKNEKNIDIPTIEEFISYALSHKQVSTTDLKLKYNSWVENGWKDGNDKKIKNWKSKLLNTIKYFDEIKKERSRALL